MVAPVHERWAVAVTACVVGTLTACYRFLATASLPNDEHEYLAGAQQMLLGGEWPTRDFFDPGRPLMYVASAAAQMVLGHTLLAEAVMTSVAFGLAAGLLLVASRRLSGSLMVATIVTVLTVALFPRPYAYPKVLLYVAGPLVMWAWVHRPTTLRLTGLAAFVAVAALIRHDHAVYLGGAAAATILVAPARDARQRIVRLATLIALTGLFMVPYAIYVESSGGVVAFLDAAWSYSTREADRTRLRLATLGWGPDSRLLYLSYLLPIAMLLWFARDWWTSRRGEPAIVLPIGALAIVTNIGFLRDPLPVRVADIAVPVLCAGWLAGRAMRINSVGRRVAAMLVMGGLTLVAAHSVLTIGNVVENFNRTDLERGLTYAPTAFGQRAAGLQARFELRHVPNDLVAEMVPFFEYVDRCTTVEHRLFVAGYAPEIFTYARRLFAGGHGQFIQGYQVSPTAQRQIIERLQQQFVLFTLLLSDQETQWRLESVPIDAYVRANFGPMAEIHIDPSRAVRVLVRNGSDAIRSGTDRKTGWPCFR